MNQRVLLLTVLGTITGSLATAAPVPRPTPIHDWAAIATDDLHFIRASLRTNHPGPADTLNPGFQDWFARGFDRALKLAARATDYPGYFFSIQYYLNGFQDGHLGALERDARLPYRWPGFMVAYRDGRFVVADAEPHANPAVGDVVVAVDDRPVDLEARDVLLDYVGLWSVRGARAQVAPYLLVDEGNPFVPVPRSVRVRGAEGEKRFLLSWRSISFEDVEARIHTAQAQYQPPFELRAFGNGGWWMSLPSFDANDTAAVAALDRLQQRIEANASALRSARILVFDVRGNHGGDSAYGTRIAAAIWGRDYVEAVDPKPTAIDWRASGVNIRALRGFLTRERTRFGDSSSTVRHLEGVVAGMDSAEARGEPYYRVAYPAERSQAAPANVAARVFFLTDCACFSACLDFADLMTHIPGVVQVGQETSADAVYIDNNAVRLPSGLGWLGYSMKVYRGRVRGNNESYVPRDTWSGTMDDTPGLERWIEGLAAGGR